MKHPNPDKIDILAETFLNLHESVPKATKVEMGEPNFQKCRTIACHAGWFGLARSKFSNGYSYEDSADDMAKFLGIVNRFELKDWAENNPDLWGNHDGDGMFCSAHAFGKGLAYYKSVWKYKPLTLKHIGNHWAKVADRIRKLK